MQCRHVYKLRKAVRQWKYHETGPKLLYHFDHKFSHASRLGCELNL